MRSPRVALLASIVAIGLVATPASSEQASSDVRSFQGGLIDGDYDHTCAILTSFQLRCWGEGAFGRLGYGNENDVADEPGETPSAFGPVDLGPGRTARAIATGYAHTCAVLDDGSVRCWGEGDSGALGYGATDDIGDNELPASAGPVSLGVGRTATAIAAGEGGEHTCAILDDGTVRCWGQNSDGQLGYGNTSPVGDDEVPGSVGPVNLGPGRTAVAITGGNEHTCAILDDAILRCWGDAAEGSLGYGSPESIGDNETPAAAGPVDLGPGRTARAVAAGYEHTCAILDDGTVRCWGYGGSGQLGIPSPPGLYWGDDPGETPAALAPVNLGAGRTAVAIAAGGQHTCVILDDGNVRCWGDGASGKLGYGNTDDIADDPGEPPGAFGPVDLGPGRTARALATGNDHTCAVLDDGTLRCWGEGDFGRLGHGGTNDVGDNETPGSVAPVSLGGPMFGAVGDLSIALKGKKAIRVGRKLKLRVSIANGGLDPAGSVEVLLKGVKGLRLLRVKTLAGAFTKSTRRWTVGPVVPGDPARAVLVVRAKRLGKSRVIAEIVADPEIFHDTDSTPGNRVKGEDDLVVRRVKVKA